MARCLLGDLEFDPDDPRKSFAAIRNVFLTESDETDLKEYIRGMIYNLIDRFVMEWERRNQEVDVGLDRLYNQVALNAWGQDLYFRNPCPFAAADYAMNQAAESIRTKELDIAEMKFALARYRVLFR